MFPRLRLSPGQRHPLHLVRELRLGRMTTLRGGRRGRTGRRGWGRRWEPQERQQLRGDVGKAVGTDVLVVRGRDA